ncbi:MAG: hypothetical protein HY885_02675 [Deltaproteobacteria bacterium]|nr:hypothetical protein [Deltaproteobacteria bacterium]
MASNAPAASELYSSGFFHPIVEQCEGCERIVEANNNKYCQAYSFPEAKWRLGICNFATHKKPEIVVSTIKINPLKAAKRASGGKKKK